MPHPIDPCAISCPNVASAYRQFNDLFGPSPAPPAQFRADVRYIVYARMIHAFHAKASTPELRRYFRMTFHPDTGTKLLTDDEKCQVFVCGEQMFSGSGESDV